MTAGPAGYRLSPEQARIWTSPAGGAQAWSQCAADVPAGWRLDGLERALGEVAGAQEILRTGFDPAPLLGAAVQVIAEPGQAVPTLERLDQPDALARPGGRVAAIEDVLASHRAAVDLTRPPLCRCTVIGFSPADRVLVLSLPSVAADAAGLIRLLSQLEDAYHGREVTVAGPQYADYAQWRLDQELSRPDPADEFWAGALTADGAGSGSEPEPGERTFGSVPVSLPWPAAGRVLAWAREAGHPVSSVLLAAWWLVLDGAGLAGRTVWTVLDGRASAGTGEMIGWFERRLPVAVCSPAPAGLTDLARALAGSCEQAARRADHAPEFRPGRGAAGFRFVAAPPAGGAAELAVTRLLGDDGTCGIDLTVHAGDRGLRLEIGYDAASCAPRTASQLGVRLAGLLTAVAAAGDLVIGELDLRTPAEREYADRWNDTGTGPARGRVIDQVGARAAAAPSAPAVIFGDQRRTYAEVDAAARRLSSLLASCGGRPGDRIAICLPRSPDQIIAVLGTWYADAAFVPLAATDPVTRLAELLDRSASRLLIACEQTRATAMSAVRQARSPVGLVMTEDAAELAPLPLPGAAAGARLSDRADAEAYVAFTSGSTGRPQAVIATWGGVANYLAYLDAEYRIGPADVVLQLAPFTFDAWIRDTIGTLAAGATAVVLDELACRSAAEIVGQIDRHGVTRLAHVVPTVLREIGEAALAAPSGRQTVLTVLSSGEPLWRADCELTWSAFGPQVMIVNQYGPTEATMTTTFERVRRTEAAGGGGKIPAGHPIRNGRLYLLDDLMRPVPAGVAAEVYLGGAGISHGYAGAPGRTASQFVPDPFAPAPGGRLYRTGDLARQQEDGQVELLGRADSQVKVHGVRIDPHEIELTLLDHPAVREAVVVPCATGPAGPGQVLVALVVGDGEAQAGLRDFAARRLPADLVPAHVIARDSLPRTSSGKVDRAAARLGAEDWLSARAGSATAAGLRSALDQLIAEAFAAALGLPAVPGDADFFACGGHSLLATKVAHQITESLRITVPLRAVFECPTPQGLADRLREQAEGSDEADADLVRRLAEAPPGAALTRAAGSEPARRPQVSRRTGAGPHPLSFAQLRLWLVDALHPGDTGHNVQVTIDIRGALAYEPLRRALRYLADRHDVLRTRFVTGPDGEPGQIIAADGHLDLQLVDLTAGEAGGTDHGQPTASVARLSRLAASCPFDLRTAPLARASLLRTGPDSHVLLLVAHHIVIDEWSVGVLLGELAHAYGAYLGGGEPELAAPALQYVDFAGWERDRLTGDRLAELVSHWTASLAGAAFEIDLPFDRPRPARREGHGDRIFTAVPRGLTDELTAVGREEGGTLFMVLLAAFAALLAHYSGRDDLIVGTPVANRQLRDFDPVVGCFVNILVLRLRTDGDPDFAELLGRVREITLDAYAHQDAPFEKVVEALRPARVAGRLPLVQNWFVLHNAAAPVRKAPGIELSLTENDRGSSKFDLDLALSEAADGLSAALEYSTDVFAASTAWRLLGRYVDILRWIVKEPSVRLSEVRRRLAESDEREHEMAAENRQQSRRASFASVRAAKITPVRVSRESLVKFGRLPPGGPLPALVEPGAGPVDLAAWMDDNRDLVGERLRESGAILWRGFGVGAVEQFEQIVSAYSPGLLDYNERSTPREVISGKVYSSTDYPPDRTIPLHPESAYSHYWPRHVWFCCLIAASAGGATPVADNREILRRLDPAVRGEFERLGVRYVRTYHEGFDIPWQVAFQTSDRSGVEDYCRRAGLTWEWRADGVLRTEHVLDAIVRHPDTGEELWFNQAHAWHLAALEPAARQAMLDMFGPDDLPRAVFYGDGSAIPAEAIDAVSAAHRQGTVSFGWHEGDVMLVDNMLAAHGREPYQGQRRVVVAMSDAWDRDKLKAAG